MSEDYGRRIVKLGRDILITSYLVKKSRVRAEREERERGGEGSFNWSKRSARSKLVPRLSFPIPPPTFHHLGESLRWNGNYNKRDNCNGRGLIGTTIYRGGNASGKMKPFDILPSFRIESVENFKSSLQRTATYSKVTPSLYRGRG